MDDRRVADYFVVAGLNPQQQLPLEEFSNEAITKPTFRLDPITDITVINRSLGEKIPKGYECLETTPTGYPANLNHGGLRCPDMFICYRRGRDKPPLKDLGILYEGKERVMQGCEVVHTTMQGNPANVNNSSSSRTYITYRRAEESAPTDTLVVVDICIILGNRGEDPPLTFLKLHKNLNKGMLGSDVFLCYKKAMVKKDILAYKASILGRYPTEDYEDFPLPESVPMFCLPMGATIECWSAEAQHPVPSFSTYILTGAGGHKVYGAAVSFYEEYKEEDLTDMQMRALGLKNKSIREQYHIQKTVHVRKSISLLSHWPFYDAFKKFLSQLYKISITGPHNVPIERHISHFMYDVPYPSPERPRILVQLTHDSLSLCMPEDSPFPQSGASFITLLRNLGPELTMNLLLFVLLENKILLHSLRPTVLTEVAEAVSTMIFPFHWQCPYIPLCPLGLSDVLNAPCPFIVGVDSRYFDLYDPPPDVICVDLDTSRISTPEDKKSLNFKLLPKKPTRVMQECLSKLYDRASQPHVHKHDTEEVSLEVTHFDLDFKRRKQDMQFELSIQEVFLRFTASILKDYKKFLIPITRQPNNRATDASSLFDMQGFLKSRDKAFTKFFSQLMHTQMFFRFIEERSFVSDKDDGLTFFDECTEKVDEMRDEPRLIEIENTQQSERTVFIMPPEPEGLPEGATYSYNGFQELKPELFLPKKKTSLPVAPKLSCPNSPLARRTKQEVKSAQKIALQQVGKPRTWAKCLLSYSYSLWFVVFPTFVQSHPKKLDALKIGFAVLKKMQEAKLVTVDELCYRVLMQLAGQYNKPGLAVQVFSQMKKHGVHPNAITYGYYNKVMLEAKWPSPQSKGRLRWLKIRNVIIGVAQFRRAIRRRSLSIYSNSGSEFDQISHASADSYVGSEGQGKSGNGTQLHRTDGPEAVSAPVAIENKVVASSEDMLNKNNGSLEERMSTGGVSDRGYNSMTQEDAKRISQIVKSVEDTGSESSPATSDSSEKAIKSKTDAWNSLNFSFLIGATGMGGKTRHNSEKNRKEVHMDESSVKRRHSHRQHSGSIVKRSMSISRQNHFDDYQMLKGSLLSNSCGLVILSQASLEQRSCLTNTDIRLEVEEAKRRRHRSAGEGHTKPARSFSIFAHWKPSKQSNGDGHENGDTTMRFSELVENDNIDSLQIKRKLFSGDDSSCNTSTNSASDEAKSSFVDSHSDIVTESSSPTHESFHHHGASSHPPETNSSLSSSTPLVTISESGDVPSRDISSPVLVKNDTSDQEKTIVFEIDPLSGESHTDPLSSSEASSHKTSEIHTSITDSTAVSDTHPSNNSDLTNNAKDSKGPATSEEVARAREIRRSVSISEDRLSGQFDVEVKATPSLAETGRTFSSPGGAVPMEQAIKQKSEDTQSVNSFTDPRKERPSDFVLTRSQSLKKTNEVIGSFLKFASKAAYTKLTELKQTITTPIKNGSLGSLGSLTHSVEELDANDGSSTSGTIRERLRYGGSQDLLSHSEESEEQEENDNHMSGQSFDSAPSPLFHDDYTCMSDNTTGSGMLFEKMVEEAIDVAMEVEMSSCSRCTRCNRLIYDEEIMAGWSAEDSNLNTSCPYCHAKFVPHLQVYLKDWRGDAKSVVFQNEQMCPVQEKLLATAKSAEHLGPPADSLGPDVASPATPSLSNIRQSSLERGEMPLSFEEAASTLRSRCTSECLSNLGDNATIESPTHDLSQRSPLTLSMEGDAELSHPLAQNSLITREFMTRSASSSEPVVVPYLSPLVLRKELEYVLDHEGNMCLAADSFVEGHPIIYWNLIWFFRRIAVPNHLTGFLLTSKALACNREQNGTKNKNTYSSRNILIRPQWDNVRIHDEIGLPMYSAWRAGHKSTVLDALVTENDTFSRKIMYEIIGHIKQNNVLNAIKLVANARRRVSIRKRRFRSMYREILFLSFAECGRENIDHDAFDREYTIAFEEKLQPAEKRRLQPDDSPKSAKVQWCRQVFTELEL